MSNSLFSLYHSFIILQIIYCYLGQIQLLLYFITYYLLEIHLIFIFCSFKSPLKRNLLIEIKKGKMISFSLIPGSFLLLMLLSVDEKDK